MTEIAKYRSVTCPGVWHITDFTMSQIEGRLRDLEKENEALRTEHNRLLAALAGTSGERAMIGVRYEHE